MAIEDRYKRVMQNTDVLNPRSSKDNAPKPQVYEEQDLFISIADHHYTDVRRDFQAEKCVGLGKLRRMNRIEVAQTNGGTPYHMPTKAYFAFDARNPASSDAACPDPYMQPVDDGRFPANFKRDLCKQISSTVEMRINEDPGDKDYAGTVCGVSSGITGRANGSTSRLQFLDTQTPNSVLKPDFYYGLGAITRAEFNSGLPPLPLPPIVGPLPSSNLGKWAFIAALNELIGGHGELSGGTGSAGQACTIESRCPNPGDGFDNLGPDLQRYARDGKNCVPKTWADPAKIAKCKPHTEWGKTQPYNWCAAFVSWAYEEGAAHLNSALPFTRSKSSLHLYYHMTGAPWPSNNMLDEPTEDPSHTTIIPGFAFFDPNLIEPGDLVSFYGHSAIAVKYNAETNILKIIEGNAGGVPSIVKFSTRNLSRIRIGPEGTGRNEVSPNIRGFVRPPNIEPPNI